MVVKKFLKSLVMLVVFFMLVQSLFVNVLAVASLNSTSPKAKGEFRGVWVSFFEMQAIAAQKTEEEFTQNVDLMFDNTKILNLTDVIIQVRPFSDAFYKSSIFPQSDLLTGEQGKDCGYDPLKIMVEKGHEKGLKVHAWVNPYRIKNPNSKFKLAKNHPALQWIKDNNNREIIKLDNGGIYYQPGSDDAKQLVINGIKEIVSNYAVDGIHMDDYFYPSKEPDVDKELYNDYILKGGSLSLNNWRIENVNSLIKGIYTEVKKINPQVVVGISPAGNVEANYEVHFSDVKKWLKEPGYVDYLCPQLYYGFENEKQPFNKVLLQWASLEKLKTVDLYIGLAAYKIGLEDQYALSGKDEWVKGGNIISEQILKCRDNANCNGFILFRYGSLFTPEQKQKGLVEKELSNIRAILKS